VMGLVERGLLRVPFRVVEEAAAISRLLQRYAGVPISLADACLVRMSEHWIPSPPTLHRWRVVYARRRPSPHNLQAEVEPLLVTKICVWSVAHLVKGIARPGISGRGTRPEHDVAGSAGRRSPWARTGEPECRAGIDALSQSSIRALGAQAVSVGGSQSGRRARRLTGTIAISASGKASCGSGCRRAVRL